MELSTLIAKIISVIYVSSGIAILIGTINLNDIVKDFDKSPALTVVAGSVGIIIGIVLIYYHNIWIRSWEVIITIISWLFLIGGIIVVIIPKSLIYFNKLYKSFRILGLFMLLFGLIIGYFGFIK